MELGAPLIHVFVVVDVYVHVGVHVDGSFGKN